LILRRGKFTEEISAIVSSSKFSFLSLIGNSVLRIAWALFRIYYPNNLLSRKQGPRGNVCFRLLLLNVRTLLNRTFSERVRFRYSRDKGKEQLEPDAFTLCFAKLLT